MANIKSYFSQRDNLQQVILKHLGKAQMSVTVAVAWFTDPVLFQKLLKLQERGVRVELIITKHQFNDESQNNYVQIAEAGGLFLEVGGDASTMHHKFCIIDHKEVLNGSFNWTRKANQSNSETLTVISEDSQTVFEFSEEFERLKRLAGLHQEVKELELGKALKYFTLIKTFIDLNRPGDIFPYLQEISGVPEFESIAILLKEGQYEAAVTEMDRVQKAYSAVRNVSFYEKEELVFRIRLVSEQIRLAALEQTSLEGLIADYNRRFILELNPIISQILEIKRRIAAQFNFQDETFEELTEEYEKINEQLAEEQEKDVPELSAEDAADIRKMYFEASKLCHPDSPHRTIEDRDKAGEIFAALSTAYKAKDYETVRQIYEDLKTGNPSLENLMASEVEQLRRRLAELELKLKNLTDWIQTVKLTEPYLTIEHIRDWDEFFAVQKDSLLKQKQDLETQYFKK